MCIGFENGIEPIELFASDLACHFGFIHKGGEDLLIKLHCSNNDYGCAY